MGNRLARLSGGFRGGQGNSGVRGRLFVTLVNGGLRQVDLQLHGLSPLLTLRILSPCVSEAGGCLRRGIF